MKGYSKLTNRQKEILHSHSLFDLLATWSFSKKRKERIAKDLAFIAEHNKKQKAKSETGSQWSRKP